MNGKLLDDTFSKVNEGGRDRQPEFGKVVDPSKISIQETPQFNKIQERTAATTSTNTDKESQ